MNRRELTAAALAVASAGGVSSAGAAEGGAPSADSTETALRQLRSPDQLLRNRAYGALRNRHKHTFDALRGIVADARPRVRPPEHAPEAVAADLIADLASPDYGIAQIVPLFIEKVDFYQPRTRYDNHPLADYPFARALSRLGLSTIPEITVYLHLKPVEEVSDDKIRLLAAVVGCMLHPHLNHEPWPTIAFLEAVVGECGRRSANLERLIAELKTQTEQYRRD